jgi:hypothetical protein
VGDLRFEAWTLPWDATFERVIADLPVERGTGTGNIRLSNFGSGSMGLPVDYDRLSDIISTTNGSLIRVYDGTTLIHEWLAQRVSQDLSESGFITVSGPDLLGGSFDRAIVYNYDYTTTPTILPNHVYGGGNKLSNPDFEGVNATPQEWELNISATGGTYTLTDGVDTTSNIDFDAQAGTIATRIQTDIASITDVGVIGTSSSPYLRTITAVDPKVGNTLNINL